eukprot:COSAG02_NODE_1785_length_10940_cov_9.153399_1_plen_36_part_10
MGSARGAARVFSYGVPVRHCFNVCTPALDSTEDSVL